jgi:hypothetical protein
VTIGRSVAAATWKQRAEWYLTHSSNDRNSQHVSMFVYATAEH